MPHSNYLTRVRSWYHPIHFGAEPPELLVETTKECG